jgi:hypothetical protein
MNLRTLLLSLLLIPLLTGCEIQMASFTIKGSNHSLTVERKKEYPWSEGWDLALVVSRYPGCQRRYPLRKAGERVRVDLYQTQPGVFILNQGKRWYVAETLNCQMQQFDEEPPYPGERVGTFRVKNGTFAFVPGDNDKDASPAGGITP